MDFLTKKDCNFLVFSNGSDRVRNQHIRIYCEDTNGVAQVYGIYGSAGLIIPVSDARPYFQHKSFATAEVKRFIDSLPRKLMIIKPPVGVTQ